ncbi:MAG: Mg-chelatase subunit ChlD, partial [Cyanobacteria bacterium J06629_18]
MIFKGRRLVAYAAIVGMFLLTACDGAGNNSTNNLDNSNNLDNFNGLRIKFLVGSALGKFCNQTAQDFNATKPQLENGAAFRVECEAAGSGDVVSKLVTLATQFKNGTLQESSPQFPTIVSVDGEIYQSRLIYQMNQLFPGQSYI